MADDRRTEERRLMSFLAGAAGVPPRSYVILQLAPQLNMTPWDLERALDAGDPLVTEWFERAASFRSIEHFDTDWRQQIERHRADFRDRVRREEAASIIMRLPSTQ